MKSYFDEFSRKLASGVSRRKAFLQLLTGAGAVGLASASKANAGIIAHAIDPSCPSICFQQSNIAFTACVDDQLISNPSMPFGAIIGICLGAQTTVYQQCLTQSQYCPPHACASIRYTLSNGDITITSVSCNYL